MIIGDKTEVNWKCAHILKYLHNKWTEYLNISIVFQGCNTLVISMLIKVSIAKLFSLTKMQHDLLFGTFLKEN